MQIQRNPQTNFPNTTNTYQLLEDFDDGFITRLSISTDWRKSSHNLILIIVSQPTKIVHRDPSQQLSNSIGSDSLYHFQTYRRSNREAKLDIKSLSLSLYKPWAKWISYTLFELNYYNYLHVFNALNHMFSHITMRARSQK